MFQGSSAGHGVQINQFLCLIAGCKQKNVVYAFSSERAIATVSSDLNPCRTYASCSSTSPVQSRLRSTSAHNSNHQFQLASFLDIISWVHWRREHYCSFGITEHVLTEPLITPARTPHRDKAVKIQSMARSRKSRRESARRRDQRVAATRIQTSARSMAAKKEAKERQDQRRYTASFNCLRSVMTVCLATDLIVSVGLPWAYCCWMGKSHHPVVRPQDQEIPFAS